MGFAKGLRQGASPRGFAKGPLGPDRQRVPDPYDIRLGPKIIFTFLHSKRRPMVGVFECN